MATVIRYICMKFPTKGEVATIIGRQDKSRTMYMETVAKAKVEEEINPKVMEVDTRARNRERSPLKH